MNFSFIAIGLGAAMLAGCTRDPAVEQAATRGRAADLIAVLKLVHQEYPNAVPPAGGAVADATEYAETELFAEQAQAKVAELDKAGDLKNSSRAAAMRDGVARVRELVGRKASSAEVARNATATIAVVEELLAGAVPEQIRG